MRPATKVAVTGLAAILALSACASVPEGAIDAEAFAPSTIDDPKIPIGPGSTIEVDGFEWGFTVNGTAVDGAVTVAFRNTGGATHNFTIDNAAGDVKVVAADPGGDATAEFQLFGGGEYTFYCSIPGHRGQGMEGTLAVLLPGETPTEVSSPDAESTPSEAEPTAEATPSDEPSPTTTS